MATFIFLHGSFHAAWNWHRLQPLLHQAGHRGIAVDLPGHGQRRLPPHRISLQRCVDTVLECIDALPPREPVVLLAHSRNGIVISQAAEQRHRRIAGLVYLAAYLVPDGRSMMDYAIRDRASLVLRNLEVAIPPRFFPLLTRLLRSRLLRGLGALLLPRAWQVHRLRRGAYFEALYHDCPPDITALACALLEEEANWPGFTPLRLSGGRYGTVPKVYIECLEDRAVTLPLQREMQAASPCDAVYALPGSHSPFFARPEALLRLLLQSLPVFGLEPQRAAA